MYIVRFIILSTREIHNINKERDTLINRRYRRGLSVLHSGTADPILSYFLLLRKNEKEIITITNKQISLSYVHRWKSRFTLSYFVKNKKKGTDFDIQ